MIPQPKTAEDAEDSEETENTKTLWVLGVLCGLRWFRATPGMM